MTLGALVLVSACSSDDGIPESAGTSTSRRATSTTERATVRTTLATAESEAEEISSRYKAFWDARFEANQDPADPDLPGLREYATGAQLDNTVRETTRNRDGRIAFRRPADSVYERRVHVVEVTSDTAKLQDCVTNDGIVYRVTDGKVVDDAVVTNSLEAVMRRVGGSWKLESTRLLQSWNGVAGCALAG